MSKLLTSFKNLKVTTQLIFWFLIIAILPLVIISIISTSKSRQVSYSRMVKYLSVIADQKSNYIEGYIVEAKKDITPFTRDLLIIDLVEKLSAAVDKYGFDSPEYAALNKQSEQLFLYLQEPYKYQDVFLISVDGDILFSASKKGDFRTNLKTGPHKNSELTKVFDRAQTLLEANISDYKYYVPYGESAAFIATPLFKGKNVVGVLAFKINTDEAFVQTWNYFGLGETGETIIGSEDGGKVKPVGSLRFDPLEVSEIEILPGSKKGYPLEEAVYGKTDSGKLIDYRNEEVLAVWRYLPSLRLGLVVKMDIAEIFAVENQFRNNFATIIIGSILLIIIISNLVVRSIFDPIKKLTKGAEIVGGGNFRHKIEIESENEIGKLATAFNQMISAINQSQEKTKDHLEYTEKQKINAERQQKAIINILKDIKEEKNNVTKEKKKIDAILESIGEGLVVTDKEGKILIVNKMFQELLGWKEEDVLGRDMLEVIPKYDENNKLIQNEERSIIRVLSGKTEKSNVSTLLKTHYYERRDKSKIPIVGVVTPIVVNEKVMGAVQVFREVTREKEFNKMRDEFLNIAAHDLRTPATIIKDYVSRILDGEAGEISDKAKWMLKEVNEGNERSIKLVGDFLSVSRLERGKIKVNPAEVNLEEIVENCLNGLTNQAQKKNLFLEYQKSESPNILADKDKMVQVINNLVGNAIKFTKKGKITISHELDKEYLITHIADTGIGINKEGLKHLFEKYYRKSETTGIIGLGLGLYICKLIINNLGGKIWAESEDGRGSIFSFSLPLAKLKKKVKGA